MTTKALLVLTLLALAPGVTWVEVAARQAPATGDPVRGRALVKEYACYYCHGTEGQGSSPRIGPRIATTPRSQESFMRYVRRPAGQMSAYSEAAIPDAALADIYAFLRSIPAPAKSADVPLLQRLKK